MGPVQVKPCLAVVGFVHLLCLSSCGIQKPPLFLALETEHFEFFREDTLPPACDTLGADLEGYLAEFSTYLEVPYPAGRKIIYNQFSTFRYLSEACGSSPDSASAGCYSVNGNVISSIYSAYPHEIVHVLEHRIGGVGHHPLLLSEGLASMLGGGAPYDRPDHRVDATLPVEDLIDDEAFVKAYSVPGSGGGGALYSTSAGFVRYLIDHYGKEEFLRFYASTVGLARGEDVKSRFSETLVDHFDDIVSIWRSAAQPIVEDLCPTAPRCAATSDLIVGDALEIDAQCDVAFTRFDVPATGRTDLIIDPRGGTSSINLRSCDGGLVIPERDVLLNKPLHLALDVPPGPYVFVATGAPLKVTYAPAPVTINVDGTCETPGNPALIGGDSGDFALVRRWGLVETSVAFDVLPIVGGRFNAVSVGNTSPGTTPRLYYDCPSSCSTDMDRTCVKDEFPPTTSTDGTVSGAHSVLGASLDAGRPFHFGTGPRFEQDWGYSVRVSVEP